MRVRQGESYPRTRPTTSPPPPGPWAVPLADEACAYHLVCFDLDAHHGQVRQAEIDALKLEEWCHQAGIPTLTCASGPGGGRHVWAASREPLGAQMVASLARTAKATCPTLDVAPLSNPATGCVRPPGSPHPAGGASTPIRGILGALTHPSAGAKEFEGLWRTACANAPALRSTPTSSRSVVVDEEGHPRLAGTPTELPLYASSALSTDATAGVDASAVLWRFLIGAARAHWSYAQVKAQIGRPGLEHARTQRSALGQRLGRTPSQVLALLARQWKKAVQHARTSSAAGGDPTFDERAGAVAGAVRALLQRADAAPGMWRGAGAGRRRVLDVLATLALKCVRTQVQADIRRLGLLAGVGRETARTALIWLAGQGWIRAVGAARGPAPTTWAVADIHREPSKARSQVVPRPPADIGSAERSSLLAQLTARQRAWGSGATTSRGVGLRAGLILGLPHLADSRLDEERLAALASLGLDCAWADDFKLEAAAHHLGVGDVLRRRAQLYGRERAAWRVHLGRSRHLEAFVPPAAAWTSLAGALRGVLDDLRRATAA